MEVRERPQDWQRFAARFHEIETNVETGRAWQEPRDPSRTRGDDRRGSPVDRGRTGRGQDDARQGHRPVDRLLVPPDPVHPRPAAHRRHRRERLQPGATRLRVQARGDLRQHRARRRDQPRLAQDPVGPAGVHGGTTGHRRHPDPPAGDPVHGDRDAEPDRARGHLPAARGAAGPLHAAAVDRLPARPRSRPTSWRATRAANRSPISAPSPTRRASPR